MGAIRGIYCIISEFFVMLIVCGVGNTFNVAPEAFYVASLLDVPGVAGNGSYFGYSVGILETSNKKWLLVGAPRANSSHSRDVNEPGVLFKCEISPSKKCKEIILDQSVNGRYYNKLGVVPFRNNAWTGMALDIDQEGNVIVSSPRWKNAEYGSEFDITGAYYIIGADLEDYSATLQVPLADEENRRYNYYDTAVYFFSLGEAGIDVHCIRSNKSQLLLGSPGVLNWQGSVVQLTQQSQINIGGISKRAASITYAQKKVPNPISLSKIEDFVYFGYSVSSGNFDSTRKLHYIAGAPRGASSFGIVFIFLYRQYNLQAVFIKEERRGTQMGEYFGASVAAPDLNNDGFSDLVVGAPMHTAQGMYEAGCVYVFMNSEKEEGTLAINGIQLFGDVTKRARFGTAIGSPGDLDLDGFEDLLIGAPYEDEEAGAVYVFMGSRLGIRRQYSQKLTPQTVSKTIPLKGFGISFSRPAYVDYVSYPDFAVGSFISDNAVILVTRPVITIQGDIASEPSKLAIELKRFVVLSCISYDGPDAPRGLDIVVKISVNEKSGGGANLANFRATGSTEHEVIYKSIRNKRICQPFDVEIINLEKANAVKPIIIDMEYSLIEEEPNKYVSPILNPYSEKPSSLILSFVTGCPNEICRADLLAHAEFEGFNLDPSLIVGDMSKITLKVEVTNKRDPAFLPNVTITFPHPLKTLPAYDHDCVETKGIRTTNMLCHLKNPLKQSETDTLSINLDVTELDDSSSDIDIEILASSAADEEVHPANNRHKVKLTLKKNASIKAEGWSNPEHFIYERKDEENIVLNKTFKIMHTYEISKTEVTPVREIAMLVEFPKTAMSKNQKEIPVMQLVTHKLFFHGQTYSCSETIADDSNLKDKASIMELPPTPKSVDEEFMHRNISCYSPGFTCASINCKIGPWKRSFDAAKLEITFVINSTTLDQIISIKDGTNFVSGIKVHITSLTNEHNFEGMSNSQTLLHTPFKPSSLKAEPLAWWIYLIAVLVGLLIILLIAFVLYKAGFFRRKMKESMQAQQATLVHNDDLDK